MYNDRSNYAIVLTISITQINWISTLCQHHVWLLLMSQKFVDLCPILGVC